MPTTTEAAALLYAALVATALGFVFWYTALHRLGAAKAGLFLGLIPVSAFVTGALLGNQERRPAQGDRLRRRRPRNRLRDQPAAGPIESIRQPSPGTF